MYTMQTKSYISVMFTRYTHLYNRHPDQHIKYTSIPKAPLNIQSFTYWGKIYLETLPLSWNHYRSSWLIALTGHLFSNPWIILLNLISSSVFLGEPTFQGYFKSK